MDITAIVISIPFLITLLGFLLSVQNYKLNKKKAEDGNVNKENEKEARMVNIEADVKYIRMAVDRTEGRIEKLEERIDKVEKDVEVLKSKN